MVSASALKLNSSGKKTLAQTSSLEVRGCICAVLEHDSMNVRHAVSLKGPVSSFRESKVTALNPFQLPHVAEALEGRQKEL